MLAIVFAMTRFHAYVYGKHGDRTQRPQTVNGDREEAINRCPHMSATHVLRLQRYVFTVEYIPGSQMLVDNALSRAYLPGDGATEFNEDVLALADHDQQETLSMVASQATIKLMKKAAVVDGQYQLLRHQISIGWPVATTDIPTDLPGICNVH